MVVALKIVSEGVYDAYEVSEESRVFVGTFEGSVEQVERQIGDLFSVDVAIQSLPFVGWY